MEVHCEVIYRSYSQLITGLIILLLFCSIIHKPRYKRRAINICVKLGGEERHVFVFFCMNKNSGQKFG